jgi:CheY-like chemotaxis protein
MAEEPLENNSGGAPAKALVLLVDDCEDQLAVLELLLKKSNFEVLTAVSVDQGVALLKKHSVDVVVSDVFMPGKSGNELATFVRQVREHANLPFIALSAASPELEQEMLAAGADRFIHKRDMKNQLGAAIRELLALQVENKLISDGVHASGS